MKPVLALTAVLLLALASPASAAGPLAGGGSGTLKPSGGTLGNQRSGSPYGAKPAEPPATRRYTSPGMTPSTTSTRPLGEDRFKPYKGSSVYSDRGGVNPYPRPGRPRGYIDPNARTGF